MLLFVNLYDFPDKVVFVRCPIRKIFGFFRTMTDVGSCYPEFCWVFGTKADGAFARPGLCYVFRIGNLSELLCP